MQTPNKLTDSFRTKSAQGATETHDIASLAERLMTSVEGAHELISSGILEPIGGNEHGNQLTFRSSDLDAIRDAIVDSTADEVDDQCKDPKQKQFATVRALSQLQKASRASAHETELVEGAVKWGSRLLKRPGATAALIGRMPGVAKVISNTASSALVGAGVGAATGAVKAGLSSDPNASILGGALKGGLEGGTLGAVGGGLGSAGYQAAQNPAVLSALDALKKKKLATGARSVTRI